MKKDIRRKIFHFNHSLGPRLRLVAALIALTQNVLHASSLDLERRKEAREIEVLLAEAEYQKAKEKISGLLKEKNLSIPMRSELYWLNGLCFVSEGNDTQAKSSFDRLLEINSDFQPPKYSSPKILKIFEESIRHRKKQPAKRELEINFSPIKQVIAGENYVFNIRLNPTDQAHRVKFHVRPLGSSEYSTLDFKSKDSPPGEYEVLIPDFLTSHADPHTSFEYFVEALASDLKIVGGIANKTSPLNFAVESQVRQLPIQNDATSSIGSVGIWISAAALALATAATLSYVFSSPNSGNLHLRVYPAE